MTLRTVEMHTGRRRPNAGGGTTGDGSVVVEVGGRAFYTGRIEFTLRAADPLPGFLVR